MSNSHRIVILLTACVNPNGMSKTVLQDVELRRKQYVNALNFYLLTECLLKDLFL